jgi:hypothetical protein
VLPEPREIHEPEVGELDVVVFAELENVFDGFGHDRSLQRANRLVGQW